MSAEYTSPKKDGHLAIRNEVYRQREVNQQDRERAMAEAAKVPAPQTNANYGFGKIKY